MKEVKLFIMKTCPYCQKALKYISKYPFKDAKLIIIDENEDRQLADTYDYYYVPSFYLNDVKIHEGAIDEGEYIELVKKVDES